LATSREALAGEHAFGMPALAIEDGVVIFEDRALVGGAGALAPEDSAITRRIVEQLDGIPLAVELAAAQLSGSSAAQVLAQLESRPERTLQTLLDGIYERSSIDEQTLFRRLAVLRGSYSRAAATAVCSDDRLPADRVSGALDALVSKALAHRDDSGETPRFRSSGAIRDYAAALLRRDDEESAVMLALVRYFGSYARGLAQRKGAMPFERWSKLQLAELDNYCVALRRSFAQRDDGEAAADILRSLGGMLPDLSTRFDLPAELRKALLRDDLSDNVKAVFWMALAELRWLNAPAESLRAAARALDLLRHSGDDTGAAYAAWLLAGAQLREHGRINATMEPILSAALSTARTSGDRHLAVGLLRNLALLQSESARHEEARQALHEAAELADRTNVGSLAALLGSTALEEFRAGNTDGAVGLWRQAASLAEESQPSYAALCFVNIGLGELTRGDLVAARVALRKGLSTLKAVGHKFGIAQSFDHFARLAKQSGDHERAARIAGFSQTSFERGPARPSTEQQLFYKLVDELRSSLGHVAFEREWGRGQWMGLDEAMIEAEAT
jgi:tetratricopeptide (TPR) repeat protein